MARHSLMFVSCCIALIALICGAGTPVPLWGLTPEEARGDPPGIVSAALVNALARQIAFVKSFSVGYPYQYRQDEPPRKAGTIAIDEIENRRNEDR